MLNDELGVAFASAKHLGHLVLAPLGVQGEHDSVLLLSLIISDLLSFLKMGGDTNKLTGRRRGAGVWTPGDT